MTTLTYRYWMGILDKPWPSDLDPSRVPFRQRTITVLKGMRLWDDMTRIDHLTVDDVAGYWVTGPVTVNDLITSGNEAIEWHHNQPAHLEQAATDDWTRQVWRRDLRFRDLLPEVDATVHDIAISGHHTHQRSLLKTLPEFEKRLDKFGRESRDEALIRYVSANTGQSRQRTTRLLQSLGLLEPPSPGAKRDDNSAYPRNGSTSSLDRYGTASNKHSHPTAPHHGYPKTRPRFRAFLRLTGWGGEGLGTAPCLPS